MDIVIKISTEDYQKVKDGHCPITVMRDAIRNGKPLPKGHMRICPQCGLEVHTDFDSCPRCGTDLTHEADEQRIRIFSEVYHDVLEKADKENDE